MPGWGSLALHALVFAFVTLLIWLSCEWMIRLEERRTERKGRRP
jgi:TRAP-type C4-dicarboxylate transport system permease small subunit